MAPKTGIVQDQLGEDGYPHLNIDTSQAVDSNIKQRNGNESLAYLFDPTFDHNGKRSYEDVYGLLRVDDEGYYYYTQPVAPGGQPAADLIGSPGISLEDSYEDADGGKQVIEVMAP